MDENQEIDEKIENQEDNEDQDLELDNDINQEDEEIEIIKDDLNGNNQIKDDDSIQDFQSTVASETPSEEEQLRIMQKNYIEGALYASGKPLDVEELATKLEFSKKVVEELLIELAQEYLERNTSLIISQVGEKFQMQLRPEYTEKISKFATGGAIAEKYLRTLTVIALKQPILKSTLIKLRGTGAYEHVKYLLDNDLINAEKKGRSDELTTTDKYSESFGLPKNKDDLKREMIKQLGLNQET
jgi:segregation and condensation protein B